MAANLTRLKDLPSGVEQGTVLIAGFDECLLLGFARLGPAQHAALEAAVAAFAGSPLHPPLGDALAAVKRSEFLAKHFAALAAGRAAIQGAQYDALFQQAAEAIGRQVPSGGTETPKAISPEGQHTALLSSTQQWLMELSLAGFKHLSMDTLSPFMATLEQMQAEPKLARLASLLTGFLTELLAATPTVVELPVFRWADLWMCAMTSAQQLPALETGATVSGTLHPLGVDVRTHAHFANLVIYGLFDTGKERRVVRVPLSSYKVDVIAQTEVWHLFRPSADPLLESLAAQKSLQVSGMHLLPGGDLLWTGKAKPAGTFDPMATGKLAAAADVIALPPQPPLTRHPVQLAELVCLETCAVRKSSAAAALGRTNGDGAALEVVVEGQALPLATERLVTRSELDPKTLESATALVGLLRFDRGTWAVQPLCARAKVGKKEGVVVTGSTALTFCKKDKSKTLATLSERAGKLLRQ